MLPGNCYFLENSTSKSDLTFSDEQGCISLQEDLYSAERVGISLHHSKFNAMPFLLIRGQLLISVHCVHFQQLRFECPEFWSQVAILCVLEISPLILRYEKSVNVGQLVEHIRAWEF